MINNILQGDALEMLRKMPDRSVSCVITSPPYWGLRDYGVDGQLGLEKTPQQFVKNMVEVFAEVRRVLKDDGTLWLNIGDSYASFRDSKSTPDSLRGKSAGTKVPMSNNRNPKNLKTAGLKHKDLCGIPWRLAFALQDDGWYLRQDIIWSKPNPMPESVKDRCTKSHEYIFLLTKSSKYHFDNEIIKEKAIWSHDRRAGRGRIESEDGKRKGKKGTGQESFVSIKDKKNKRSVWSVPTRSFRDAHFATFPEALIEPMVRAGCPMGGVILDPFFGAGTTGVVAIKNGRNYVGIELNKEYIAIAEKRIAGITRPMF